MDSGEHVHGDQKKAPQEKKKVPDGGKGTSGSHGDESQPRHKKRPRKKNDFESRQRTLWETIGKKRDPRAGPFKKGKGGSKEKKQ